jgi:glycosyltransferase involved in cell wall biosynthesis
MGTVLYVNPSGDVSGGENSLLALIGGLGNGYRPLVACPCPGRFPDRCRELGVPVFPIPFTNPARSTLYSMLILRPMQNRTLIGSLESIVREQKVDLIHANSYLVGPASSVVANHVGIPAIWHIRDIRRGLKRRIVSHLVDRFPDRVLVVSQAVKDTLGGNLNGKVQVIYNGVEPPVVTPGAREKHRAEFGIGRDEPLVGNAGILTYWKGQDIFLCIAARVLERTPNARFLVVGGARPQSLGFDGELRKLVDDLGIADRVIFTGFREDALSLIASLDVYVHASREPDPLPRAVLEAMAVGVPVVAPANGGIPEALIDGECGFLYRTADIDQAVDRIARILEDRDLARRISCAAGERARSCFSVQQHVSNVEAVYADLLSNGSRQSNQTVQG